MLTTKEVQLMKSMRANGEKLTYIAFKIGCSISTVWEATKGDDNHINYWTQDEINTLINLKDEGVSFSRISLIVNRSINGCKRKYYKIKKGMVQ